MQKAQSSPHLASVALSDQNVKSTNHYKYLGTVLGTEFSDNKNIQTTAIINLCIKQAGASFSRCSDHRCTVVRQSIGFNNSLKRRHQKFLSKHQIWC